MHSLVALLSGVRFVIKPSLTKEAPVAVYCKSGRRSRKAANILTELGFNVYNLDKGIEDWKKNKKNIEK